MTHIARIISLSTTIAALTGCTTEPELASSAQFVANGSGEGSAWSPPDASFEGQSGGSGSFTVISGTEGRFAGTGTGSVGTVAADAGYSFASSSYTITFEGLGSLSQGQLKGSVSGALVGQFEGTYSRGSDGRLYGSVGFANLQVDVIETLMGSGPREKLVDADASASFQVGISLQSPLGGTLGFTSKLWGVPALCPACATPTGAATPAGPVLPEGCRCVRGNCDWLWSEFIDTIGPNHGPYSVLMQNIGWICPLDSTTADVIATQCGLVEGTALDRIKCLMDKLGAAVPAASGGWWDVPDFGGGWVCRHYAACFSDLAGNPFLGGFPGASETQPTGKVMAAMSDWAGHAYNVVTLENGATFYADAYNSILIACNAGAQ